MRRQRLLVEERVVGEQAVAEAPPPVLGHHGRRPGGEDDGLRLVDGRAHLHGPRSPQPGFADDEPVAGELARDLRHRAGEAVALAADVCEDGRQIDGEALGAAQPRFVERMPSVELAGDVDERLRGHAAHTGARRAQRPLVDDDVVLRLLPDLPEGGEPGAARADDDDLDVFLHAASITGSGGWTQRGGVGERESVSA